MPIWLSKGDVAALMDTEQTLEAVEQVFRAHGEGRAVVPTKISLDLSQAGADGWMNSMPAYVVDAAAAGIKFAGGFIHNPERENLPYVMATILLIDPRNGLLKAVMDGYQITIERTGAAPAVAARYLRPEFEKLAVIGAGAVGRAVVRAFDRTHRLKEIWLHDISEKAAREALDSLRGSVQTPLEVAASARACVTDAEVVVTATHANSPLFNKKDAVPGCLILPLGSFCELDPALVMEAGARIVDHLGQNMHRGEFFPYFRDGKLAESDIYAEIGEIVAGSKPVPDTGNRPLITSLIGIGSLDIALAKRVYDAANSKGLGLRFE
ncbi:MAG: ornithine cyclodeaminase family protein [Spirochaetales bacterium]|nr:ornithine cyclodeaminase family protein [Spirochaetales bacterium]